MNTEPDPNTVEASVESDVKTMLSTTRESIHDQYQECRSRISQAPAASMLIAVAAGYCLHRLPLRAIMIAKIRIFSALVKPALFLYGSAKVYEFLKNNHKQP